MQTITIHSPGPWAGDADAIIYASDDTLVADIRQTGAPHTDAANAHLIAAAPQLDALHRR